MAQIERSEDTGEHVVPRRLVSETTAKTLAALSLGDLPLGERIMLVEMGTHSIEEALGPEFGRTKDGVLSVHVSDAEMRSMKALPRG